jgi:hypothetical protein
LSFEEDLNNNNNNSDNVAYPVQPIIAELVNYQQELIQPPQQGVYMNQPTVVPVSNTFQFSKYLLTCIWHRIIVFFSCIKHEI